MLSISRKSDYALIALAGLATGQGASSARELAEQFRLPLPALRNILKRLASCGVLQSTQGPSGGYALARPADRISMGEVVSIIDGPVRLMPCCEATSEAGAAACQREDACRIKATVQAVHHRIVRVLDDVSIAELATPAAAAAPSTDHHEHQCVQLGALHSETE